MAEALGRVAARLLSPVVGALGPRAEQVAMLEGAVRAARALQAHGASRGAPPGPQRVALALPPGPAFVSALWGCWLAGAAAVPLGRGYPAPDLVHVLRSSEVCAVLASPSGSGDWGGIEAGEFAGAGQAAASEGVEVLLLDDAPSDAPARADGRREDLGREVLALLESGKAAREQGALVVYTSGTTGRPKGALWGHSNLEAQTRAMAGAWKWSPGDEILHALPLHHVHGLINALLTPLSVGASVRFLDRFSACGVWRALIERPEISVFMGVPTMYAKLLAAWEDMPRAEQAAASAAARRLRLAVCGSAACPVPILERWRALAGQLPLERYGMTETGMALSNPYAGERRPGSVGAPLPGVEVRVSESDELLVRGPSVFRGYLGEPEKTREAFTADGYFKTGDTVAVGKGGYFTIKGRTSADILKVAGYKVSALEIESKLSGLPGVAECAVVGLSDETMGQKVGVLMVWGGAGEQPTLEALQEWAAAAMPRHHLPRALRCVDAIPRNAMGKVNKVELARFFE